MRPVLLPLLTLLISSICLSCSTDVAYSEFQDVNPMGWHEDSVLTFCGEIPDSTQAYSVTLYVRHDDHYPYQNMWLFINETDTIEFYLADDHGRWLSNTYSMHHTMPVLYEENVHFLTSQPVFRIQHGMRSESLVGVTNVGIEISKKENK